MILYSVYNEIFSTLRNDASFTCQSGRPGMADLRNSSLASSKISSNVEHSFSLTQAQPQKVRSTAAVLRIYAWQVRVRVGERGGVSIYGSLTHHLLQTWMRFIGYLWESIVNNTSAMTSGWQLKSCNVMSLSIIEIWIGANWL